MTRYHSKSHALRNNKEELGSEKGNVHHPLIQVIDPPLPPSPSFEPQRRLPQTRAVYEARPATHNRQYDGPKKTLTIGMTTQAPMSRQIANTVAKSSLYTPAFTLSSEKPMKNSRSKTPHDPITRHHTRSQIRRLTECMHRENTRVPEL